MCGEAAIRQAIEHLEDALRWTRERDELTKRVEQLEDENDRLQQLVTELGGEASVGYDRKRGHLRMEVLVDEEVLRLTRAPLTMISYHVRRVQRAFEKELQKKGILPPGPAPREGEEW